MMRSTLLGVTVEQTVPRRLESVMPLVGDSLASAPPYFGLWRIVDKSRETMLLESRALLPGPYFRNTIAVRLGEQGGKTRFIAVVDLRGLLAWLYVVHWLPAVALYLVQSLWTRLFNPELVGLMQSWVMAILVVWPAILFLILRARWRERLAAYAHNLVFHS
ncbi:MAG: hypothetical protein C4523_10235 [Myxococcales bacterium]|nr:MAG: hypothetical protein C4523_10235 [Myxococcales bacterium]